MISNETLQRMAKGPTAFPAHALKDALEELIARRQSGTVYAVIQEGGSSLELYLHVHDTPEAAEAHRLSCANNGYRTTEPIGLPDNTNWSAMETLLQSVSTLDYPERDGEPPLCGCGARHWVHED